MPLPKDEFRHKEILLLVACGIVAFAIILLWQFHHPNPDDSNDLDQRYKAERLTDH